MRQFPATPEEWGVMPVVLTDEELRIGDWQVMQTWERPLMQALAKEVTASAGDVLEVGFGMGISANEIVRQGCRTYTVIEAHPKIANLAREWGEQQKVPVTVLEGLWQNVVPGLSRQFDGVLFDTYPLSEEEKTNKNHFYPFIPVATNLLRAQGVLTYYSDETVDFRAEHLKLLLTHFEEVKLVKVTGLQPPPNCEYWHEPYMIVPVAKKLL